MPHFRLVRLTEKSRSPPLMRPIASLPRKSGTIAPGCARVPVEKAVLEPRQAEEVVLLLEVVDRPLVDRAQFAVDQLVVGVVLLARHAVLAAVEVELDVAGVVTALQQLDDGALVTRFGRADEVVVGDLEPPPCLDELRGDPVGELLRRRAGGLGRLLDLETVLVGAGEELDVVAEQPVPARQRITDDGCVGVAEVRLGVDVVDRGRDVEPTHAGHATEPGDRC